MSIITSTNLANLWREAQRDDAHETKAIAFWQHYLTRIAFPEERWIVSTEFDPAINSLRRVDLAVRFSDSRDTLRVLCFFEGKKHSASREEIIECERQALNACRQHLDTHDQDNLYAVTGYGTRVKAWSYEKNDTELLAMDPQLDPRDSRVPQGYIEAHSSDAAKLTAAFARMRLMPPATPASVNTTRHQQPTINLQPQQLSRHTNTPVTQTQSRHGSTTGHADQDSWTEVQSRQNPANARALQFRKLRDNDWQNMGHGWEPSVRNQRNVLVKRDEKLFFYFN